MLQLGESTPQTSTAHAILRERVEGLFEQLHLPIFRYVMCKTRNSWMADDITQESFLRLYRHLRDEHPVENPKAWLFAVAHNLAIDSLKGERQFKTLDDSAWEHLEVTRSSAQNDHEKTMLERERRKLLREAVRNLTPLQRECLHLRAEGLRLREIADLLRISISTVADATRRASVKLAREFTAEVAQ
jgi:RNA polymerase sigma-70 factor (ECF subfamily)